MPASVPTFDASGILVLWVMQPCIHDHQVSETLGHGHCLSQARRAAPVLTYQGNVLQVFDAASSDAITGSPGEIINISSDAIQTKQSLPIELCEPELAFVTPLFNRINRLVRKDINTNKDVYGYYKKETLG